MYERPVFKKSSNRGLLLEQERHLGVDLAVPHVRGVDSDFFQLFCGFQQLALPVLTGDIADCLAT
jgi:hypothetical protein